MIAAREQIAAHVEAIADNYPEDVFPSDGTSRDAISGTAMRHAYRNAARSVREDWPGPDGNCIPKLAGLAEVAGLAGVSRTRAGQLANHPDFPEPVQRLAMGPVWLEADVQAFLDTPRKPGRKPAST